MPFLQKFALIVWVRIPPGTLSDTAPAKQFPPSSFLNKLTTADRTNVRPACLGRHGMVTAPKGGLPAHTWVRRSRHAVGVPRAVMVWSQKCPDAPRAPHAPLSPLEPRLRSYTVQRRDHGEHTSGSPIVEEPRLTNMSYTACKAAATR